MDNLATCNECVYRPKCISLISYEMGFDEVTGKMLNDIEKRCKDFKPKSEYEHKRGEWIKHKPDPKLMDEFHKLGIGRAMNRNSIFWTCSCCGGWGTPVHKFCSQCGADMRKEDNNA